MPNSIRNVLDPSAGAKAPEDWSTPERSAASMGYDHRGSVLAAKPRSECAWQAQRDTAFDRSRASRTIPHASPFESGVTAAALQDAAARLNALRVAENVSFPNAVLRRPGTLTCSATPRGLRRLAAVFVILHSAFVIPSLQAHPADISYLRVKVERQRVELRFTFNLLTLTRFAAIDGNRDHRIERSELDAATPALIDYLNGHIQTRINDGSASLGSLTSIECVWPAIDGKQPPAADADYPQRYVDLVFSQEAKPLLADIWLGFEIWKETGPLGTIEATYEQDDLRMQVPFSSGEPDYLYDTGFAVEDLFSDPQSAAMPAATAGSARVGLLIAVVVVIVLGAGSWLLRRQARRRSAT